MNNKLQWLRLRLFFVHLILCNTAGKTVEMTVIDPTDCHVVCLVCDVESSGRSRVAKGTVCTFLFTAQEFLHSGSREQSSPARELQPTAEWRATFFHCSKKLSRTRYNVRLIRWTHSKRFILLLSWKQGQIIYSFSKNKLDVIILKVSTPYILAVNNLLYSNY
jgi:hypothetical protein